MPIVDALIVMPEGTSLKPDAAANIAESVSKVLKASPGHVWVRSRAMPATGYAENGTMTGEPPVFVTVLHSTLPPPEKLAAEAAALAEAVGHCLGRPAARVHIEYSPEGRGRVAFGGRLLV